MKDASTARRRFNVPFFGTEVSVSGFLSLGPVLLIGMSIYLHIFVGRLRALGVAPDGHAATFVFTMPGRAGAVASALVLYWFVPLVLLGLGGTKCPP